MQDVRPDQSNEPRSQRVLEPKVLGPPATYLAGADLQTRTGRARFEERLLV